MNDLLPPPNGPLGPIVPPETELILDTGTFEAPTTPVLHWQRMTYPNTVLLCGAQPEFPREIGDTDVRHTKTCGLCEDIAWILQLRHEDTTPPPQILLRWSTEDDEAAVPVTEDSRVFEGVACPHCGAHDTIADFDQASRNCEVEFYRHQDGSVVGSVADPDRDFHTVRYLCTDCRRSVSISKGVELIYS